MTDAVMNAFLRRQAEDGLALASQSDLVDIEPIGTAADRFLVHFTCRGLIQRLDGSITESTDFVIGIWFPADYLRVANPFRVVTWLGPANVWHPNIAIGAGAICVGRLAPGTGLVDLIYQCWEIITWNRVTMREDDALNLAACQWARAHQDRFPVDTRPLKRRALALHAQDISRGTGHASA